MSTFEQHEQIVMSAYGTLHFFLLGLIAACCPVYYVTGLMRLGHAHSSAPAPISDITPVSDLLSTQHLCVISFIATSG